jgi:inhibitor of the pro-sigma K processing machinery
MDLMQKVAVGLVALFLIIALLRIFRAPLRLALKLLLNTLMGFAALWLVNLTAGFTGLALGVNLWNSLVIAILGFPGLILLILLQWIL